MPDLHKNKATISEISQLMTAAIILKYASNLVFYAQSTIAIAESSVTGQQI